MAHVHRDLYGLSLRDSNANVLYSIEDYIYMVRKCPDRHSCLFMKGMDRLPTRLTWSFVTFAVGSGIGN